MQTMEKLTATTLQSSPLTHSRLKYLAAMAHTSEDHISRLGMGLSLAEGKVDSVWSTKSISSEVGLLDSMNEKKLRGRTLFKDELAIWMALVLRHQTPADYDEWRQVMRSHWERGVEILMEKSIDSGDWLLTIRACLPN